MKAKLYTRSGADLALDPKQEFGIEEHLEEVPTENSHGEEH
jgi:hypothetical protein